MLGFYLWPNMLRYLNSYLPHFEASYFDTPGSLIISQLYHLAGK